jgi:N utilization substance protein A
MAAQSDLIIAINQIAAERNIDPREVLEAIKQAIKTGFRRDYPEEEGSLLEVEISPEMGAITVYANKKVVDEVSSPATQIGLKAAKNIEPKLKAGDHVLVDITPSGDFGRVAAQAAKQVILQKIRESEKESVMKEFTDKIGEIDYGVVQRMDGDNVIFEIRRALAVMPLKDRIPAEFYKSGNRMKVLLKEIKMTPKGKQLTVSRADNDFLVGLFKLEIPEIVSGTVKIMAIAREPGSRSKVAVISTTDGVDPIGACVGQRGVRISAIMNELRFGSFEEKIDIILYDEDPATFIANALSPAQVNKVDILDAEARESKVTVPDEQFSLAIGREGQNVRLAAKLTGYSIDIQGETMRLEMKALNEEKEKAEKKAAKKVKKSDAKNDLETAGLSKKIANALSKAGINTTDELKKVLETGEKIKGIGPKAMEEIKSVIK